MRKGDTTTNMSHTSFVESLSTENISDKPCRTDLNEVNLDAASKMAYKQTSSHETATPCVEDGPAVHAGFPDHSLDSTSGPTQITRTGSYIFMSKNNSFQKFARRLYGMSQNEYAAQRRSPDQFHVQTKQCFRKEPIDPRSIFRFRWDLFIGVLVLYSIFTVPFRLAFYYQERIKDPLFYIGILVDICFIVDLYLNFFTGYWSSDDTLVMDVRKTARHYLQTSFIVDFLSVLPVDYISVGAGSNIAPSFRILRLLRLLRLLRVFRIFRYASRYLTHISTVYLRIGKLVAFMIMYIHVNACMQFLLPRLENFPSDSWVSKSSLQHANVGTQYIWSIFTAASHCLCIAYGRFEPERTSEAILTTVSMLIGASLFAGIIAAVTALMLNRDTSGAAYRRYKEDMELYMRDHKLPNQLRERVRDFITQRWAFHRKFDEVSILQSLPGPLQRSIQLHRCADVVRSVPLLVDANEGFLQAFVGKLKVELVLANETVIVENEPSSRLYMIGTGECVLFYGISKVLTLVEGSFFGELALLWQIHEPFTVCTQSDSYLYSMSKQDFEALMDSYPDAREVMRKVAMQRLRKLRLGYVLDEFLSHHQRHGAFDHDSKLNRLNTLFREAGNYNSHRLTARSIRRRAFSESEDSCIEGIPETYRRRLPEPFHQFQQHDQAFTNDEVCSHDHSTSQARTNEPHDRSDQQTTSIDIQHHTLLDRTNEPKNSDTVQVESIHTTHNEDENDK